MTEHWTTADVGDLTGRVALVTGANAGLGLEITDALTARGARVLMACRNPSKAEAAIDHLRARRPSCEVELVPLDLASLKSVRRAAAEVVAGKGGLDLLVNNAGLMAVDRAKTDDGFEMQFGVNHLGHFALTAALLPRLLATPNARIVTMSSMGHRAGRMHFDDLMFERHRYQRWGAYFQSKLANLLFTRELQRRLEAAGASTQALAAHPGGSRTDLGFEGSGFLNKVLRLSQPVLQPAARGAEPTLRAATDPQAKGGEYYGPRWMMRGRAVVETPSSRARREADARRLWTVSEALTGTTVDVTALLQA